MKIAVVSDHKRFDDFIKFYRYPKEYFKCVSKLRDAREIQFDHYIKLYTHLDLYDCVEELKIHRVPQITMESLKELFHIS